MSAVFGCLVVTSLALFTGELEPARSHGCFAAQIAPPPLSEVLAGQLLAATPDERLEAARALVDATTADWPDGAQTRFLRRIAPGALAAAVDEGLLPSLLLAQAAHESGWGKSRIARDLHNLYGHARSDGWRVYPSWTSSVRAHARLLGHARRYAKARAASDHRGALALLSSAYAADPDYARRVNAIVDQWGLDRWDHLTRAAPAA